MVGITSLIAVFLALGTSGLAFEEIVIVSLIATAQTIAMLFVAGWLRPKSQILARFSAPLLLVVLVAIGSIRGWLIYELTAVFSPDSTVALPTRILNSAITITIWGMVFSLIESRLRFFQHNYRRNFAERAFSLASRDEFTEQEIAKTIDQMDSIQSLQANLRQIANSTESREFSHSQLIGAANKIRSEIENSLRPLSRRMWFDSAAAQPKFHIWELLKESLRNIDIRWYPTSFLITAAFFLGALSIYDPISVIIRVGAYGLTLSALLFLLEKVRAKVSGSTSRGATVLFGIAILSNLVGEIAVSVSLYEQLLTTELLLAIAGPAATIGLLWVEAAFAQMRKDWGAIALSPHGGSSVSTDDLVSSRFAGYLHNSLQSQLAGIALALETTNPSDKEKVAELVERLKVISNKSIGVEFTSRSKSPMDRIAEIARAWSGIATVQYLIPEQLASHPKLELVAEIIEEAINNAVRHSKADAVLIAVHEMADGLNVEIVHKAENTKSGKGRLGQLWLERFSKQHSVDFTADGQRRLKVSV